MNNNMQQFNEVKITSADLKTAFEYLLEAGFVISGESTTSTKATIGFLGQKINILLALEYKEANFDFSVIDKQNSAVYQPIWRILQSFDRHMNLAEVTPKNINDKKTLNVIAEKFRYVLHLVKDDPGLLQKR
jgi:hypothetical protein